MALAPTLQKHLDQNVTYEVITHDPTMSSRRTAQACHVSGDRLAKAIVLRRDGGYMLAVLPASHHIRLPDLRQQVGDDVRLADETEIERLKSLKLLDQERVAMKLDRVSVLLGVVGPTDLACLLLESPKETVAGAHEQQIPRDRGGGEYSTAGVVRPEDPGIGRRIGGF